MDPRYLVLSIVKSCPEGVVPGRTVLQKLGYFCSTILGYGTKFRPHFFGPYSTSLSDAAASMEALGYIDQDHRRVGGSIRHDYRITPDGEELFEGLTPLYPDIAKISDLVSVLTRTKGWDNVQVISWAAKVDFVLRRADTPMTREAIAKEAGDLGWKLGEEGIRDDVIKFLLSIGVADQTR